MSEIFEVSEEGGEHLLRQSTVAIFGYFWHAFVAMVHTFTCVPHQVPHCTLEAFDGPSSTTHPEENFIVH
jgi:hypothetical protein